MFLFSSQFLQGYDNYVTNNFFSMCLIALWLPHKLNLRYHFVDIKTSLKIDSTRIARASITNEPG